MGVSIKDDVANIIELHLSWATEKNNGVLKSEELADSILQVLDYQKILEYAQQTAKHIHSRHPEFTHEWEVSDDLWTVISQIDSMTAPE